ncbi:MAG: ABC transporter permease [Gammaproteobacteria bacterium]|nr:ABC transporter permease [Gammaproteobacteria bacterium]
MFIALRDLQFAKGRFFLMGFVVALVSFLVIVLSGLSAGLTKANISGLMELPATHIAFEDTDHLGYRNSMIERYMWEGWESAEGIDALEPMGHAIFNARTEDDKPIEIALWGLVDDSFIEPPVNEGIALGGPDEAGVLITRGLIDEGLKLGDLIVLDRVLTKLRVVGVVDDYRSIGHMPIIYAPLAKWQEASYGPPGGPSPGEKLPDIVFDFVSVIVMQLAEGVDVAALDDEFETLTLDRIGFYEASSGYTDELKSIRMIQLLLFVISAVVTGAFFSIWTIQRTKEIGLVKALGASNAYVLRDALGQAMILILIGIGIGVSGTYFFGNAIRNTELPFMIETGALVTSVVMLLIAGVVGAGLAIKRVASIDPIIALGRDQ